MAALPGRPRSEPARYHLIEALRGLACLAVVFFHSLASRGPDLAPVYGAVKQATGWGWLGVEVFFAISGWCIAERLAKAVERQEAAGHFIAERLLRIYPTYWAVVVLTIAVRLASAPFNTVGFSAVLPSGWKDWRDTVLITHQLGSTTPFMVVSWSLLYELAFYGLALAALVALRRRLTSGRTLFAIGAVAALASLVWPETALLGHLLGFWMSFFVGVAAWWSARRGRTTDGVYFLLAFLVILVADEVTRTPVTCTAFATGIVLWAGWHSDRRFADRPAVRALRSLGAMSYSLYLIHVTILTPVINGGARLVPAGSLAFGLIWLVAIAAAVVAGWAINRYIEAPIEGWRRRVL